MNLALFGIDPGAALPDRHAHWRPLVRDAVNVFLEGLSPDRLIAMAQAQSALGHAASPERRLATLMLQSPLLHKLGQVLARHPSLSRPIRLQFQRLETMAPSHTLGVIRPYILAELGDAIRTFSVEIDEEPLAEGSVATVIPCRWRPTPTDSPREGVLKILKPGIVERLDEDLRVLDLVMAHLDAHKGDYDIPGMAYRDTLESVRDLLRSEVQLDQEQKNMREASRAFYRRRNEIKIAALLPFCTPRLTAMERLHGVRVTDVAESPVADDTQLGRPELTAILMRALIADCVFSKEDTPMYHADPHAGNLWATDDGRLGILDWSLAGRLDKRHRETLARITLGALRLSRREVVQGLLRLCDAPESAPLIRPAVDKALRRIRRGRLPGIPWLTDLLEDVAAKGLVFPSDLVLFRKSLFTLKGVLADIDPSQSADWLFLKEAARHFAKELPSRWVSLPFSRAHSTHVSNADLIRTYLSAPLTFGRFWAGTLRDLLPSS